MYTSMSRLSILVYRHLRCSLDGNLVLLNLVKCLPTEEKWSLLGVDRCFWRVLGNYYFLTKFNSSLGMEYNGELYGFSAVKVK